MAGSFLRLNVDKTERILIGKQKHVAKIQNIQVLVVDNAVKPSACAKNLGV